MTLIREALPFDFVVSYNQEHGDLAMQVLRRLEALGLQGWMDDLYRYAAGVSLEQQLAKAWRMTRFIVLLVPPDFRDSLWCRVECGEGLAAENDLPLTQVLVLRVDSGRTPESLQGHPSFCDQDLETLGKYIHERRRCMRESPGASMAVRRWQAASERLRGCHAQFDAFTHAQLSAVDTICAWVAERVAGDFSVGAESVPLTLIDAGSQQRKALSREAILWAAFSDALEVDAVPFQRAFLDAVLFSSQYANTSDREGIDRILWDQLLVLTCATNRFFRSQMLEVAQDIVSSATFSLFDEEANNHFLAVAGAAAWASAVGKHPLSKDRAGAIAAAGGKPVASVVEHVALARWQQQRHGASQLVDRLPVAERVKLAAKAFRLMALSFLEAGVRPAAPRHSELLGLSDSASPMAHLSPELALERFYLTLQEIFGRGTFDVLQRDVLQQFKEGTSTITHGDLAAVAHALVDVIPVYVSYLDVAGQRKAVGGLSLVVSAREAVAFLDYVVGPYALLAQAGIDVHAARAHMFVALAVLRDRGTVQAAALAQLIAAGMDRPEHFRTVEFKVTMLDAVDGERL